MIAVLSKLISVELCAIDLQSHRLFNVLYCIRLLSSDDFRYRISDMPLKNYDLNNISSHIL